MNVAVIGTGFGRRVVAPAFAATDGCTVAGVVSARDDAAVAALVRRSDVDLVSVHSPPFLHARHVRDALAQGRAVLCDKPFALDAHEAAALESEARAAGVVALCNFEFRFVPARRRLRELLRAGTAGTVEHVRWTHHSRGTRVPLRPWGWLFDRDRGGGWVGAWASHAVDALRWLLDAEVAVVEATRQITVRERPDGRGVLHECTAEDALTATLLLSTGATVAFDSGFAAAADTTPRLTVFGSDAVVEVAADTHLTIRRGSEREPDALSDREEPGGDHHVGPMHRFAAVVRDAVTTGAVPADAPTFADGRACDVVLDALRAAPLVV